MGARILTCRPRDSVVRWDSHASQSETQHEMEQRDPKPSKRIIRHQHLLKRIQYDSSKLDRGTNKAAHTAHAKPKTEQNGWVQTAPEISSYNSSWTTGRYSEMPGRPGSCAESSLDQRRLRQHSSFQLICVDAMPRPCSMFADDIKLLGTANSEAIQGDLDKIC